MIVTMPKEAFERLQDQAAALKHGFALGVEAALVNFRPLEDPPTTEKGETK